MPVATNTEFVDALLDVVETGPAGTGSITGEEARTNLLAWLEQWTGGSVLAAPLANRFAAVLTDWDAFTQGIWELFNTPADGGPNNDGYVVVYDHNGVAYTLPGYLLMTQLMEKGDPGSTTADVSLTFDGISSYDAGSILKVWKATTDGNVTPANCSGDADNGATGTRVFSFYKGGSVSGGVLTGATLLGTITFAAGGNGAPQAATTSFPETEIEKGDIIRMVSPAASDATLADVLLVFSVTRLL